MARPKTRGNGTGTAYKRKNSKYWTAEVVVGWRAGKKGNLVPIKKTRAGFTSRKEAINYCAVLLQASGPRLVQPSLKQLYDRWEEFYSPRVVSSTMDDYRYAFKHFSPLHDRKLDTISPDELQKCMDDCPSGHRTHQNMKCVAGLLWKYAMDQRLAPRNIAENLFIGHGQSVQRDPLTDSDVKKIRSALREYRYADYAYCLCYLGFRPGELLELRKDMLHFSLVHNDETGEDEPIWYLVNGKKTPAGKDRILIVPDQILDIVLSRLYVPGTDLLFPQYKFNRELIPKFKGFKQMTHSYFREEAFKPMLKKLSISGDKVPYCARHTYADLLKHAEGTDKDKAALIGHSKYMFTQDKYQSSHLLELKAIVNSFK